MNSVPGGDAQVGDQLTSDAAESLLGVRTHTDKDLVNRPVVTRARSTGGSILTTTNLATTDASPVLDGDS